MVSIPAIWIGNQQILNAEAILGASVHELCEHCHCSASLLYSLAHSLLIPYVILSRWWVQKPQMGVAHSCCYKFLPVQISFFFSFSIFPCGQFFFFHYTTTEIVYSECGHQMDEASPFIGLDTQAYQRFDFCFQFCFQFSLPVKILVRPVGRGV